jgi:hypothetical protein
MPTICRFHFHAPPLSRIRSPQRKRKSTTHRMTFRMRDTVRRDAMLRIVQYAYRRIHSRFSFQLVALISLHICSLHFPALLVLGLNQTAKLTTLWGDLCFYASNPSGTRRMVCLGPNSGLLPFPLDSCAKVCTQEEILSLPGDANVQFISISCSCSSRFII